MNYRHLLLRTMVCLVLLPGLSLTGWAQLTDEDDIVMQLGPNPEHLQVDLIQRSVARWEWKSELSERQQMLIRETAEEWHQRMKVAIHQLNAMQESLESAGVPTQVDSKYLHQIADQSNALKSQIAGLQAAIAKHTDRAKSLQDESKLRLEMKLGELEILKGQHSVLQHQLNRLGALYKTASINKSELEKAELELRASEAELNNVHRQIDLLKKHADGENRSVELTTVVNQLKVAEQQLQNLTTARKTINKLDAISKRENLEADLATARKMIEIATEREFELRLENTRYLALLQLAKERLNARSEEESQSEGEPDQTSKK